ncbi:hypothetical protein DEJ50_24015 [Streptomyces venezuelae]|uniref:DNA-directed RNA polymerase specialized sigma24 family protein n=1 Tax=Streptomyces venezuelae TaxID=54571 RepID=A0A5P2D6Q5_STRVZ|nr:hypothetical protein [Streptomyces venezuelae]QES50433.1 hypothetical protein DEJ50_24015 [Streptomyces venezuelae]
MTAPDTATRPASAEDRALVAVDLGRAEAALVEHYPRLVRMAYLVLPPALGRNRRVLGAHALVQRALPRGRAAAGTARVPAQRGAGAGAAADPGYAYVRLRVLRAALEAGLPLTFRRLPRRAQLPPLLPQVWGLRLFPRSGGAEELALDQWLATLSGPARAACVLRVLEGLPEPEVLRVLAEAGAEDPAGAVAESRATALGGAGGTGGAGGAGEALLSSPEFDPCVLQARPTDLLRRRRYGRAGLAAGAALLVCGALLALPDGGWGADGAAAPPYARNAAAEQALDPGGLTRVAPTAWRTSSRTDFSAWPARGSRTGDTALLRRALAVWARPGAAVVVSATPGTPSGPPMGPAQLLYAGEVDQAVVVLLYDGLRVVRYAEPRTGTAGAALDFARTDGASAETSGALVLSRVDGNVRYLTAPWVTGAAARDLLKPADSPAPLRLTADGVTPPVPSPAPSGACTSWTALALTAADSTALVTDLGELTPARLTSGTPAAPAQAVAADWSKLACLLPAARSHGVRSVNSWAYAKQPLPEGNGTAAWLCTRAETWRGTADRVQAQFLAPGAASATAAAQAEGSPACGERQPRVLAGVLWKSRAGQWYVLAAGSAQFTSLEVAGGAKGRAQGSHLAVKAPAGAQVELTGRLADGTKAGVLR